MKIAIRAFKWQQQELNEKGFAKGASIHWLDADERFYGVNADVFFDLAFDDSDISANEFINDKPVFVHAVNCTLKQIDKPNYIRLNAWRGFLKNPVIELVCDNEETKQTAEGVLKRLNWQYAWVKDDYGLIAARIIAMIINEAYYALEQNVSTKQQIDIAMQLGTNYPFGPFEWSKKIGLKNIYNLLKQLSAKDDRYSISALLAQESNQI